MTTTPRPGQDADEGGGDREHQEEHGPADRSGPGPLSLAVAASLAVAWALRSTGTPRLGAAYCLGWLAVLGLAIGGRPEGDHVLAGDPAGYVMMATGFLLVVLGVTSLGRGEVPTGT